ncbi:hypothetical protein BDL97_12G100000 [Sphagnum fallax]|nr:hypothetical protein BDL97_12G100000 [Sphagnum fallax]
MLHLVGGSLVLFQGGNNQSNLAAVCIAHKNMMMLLVIMSLAAFACKGLVQALPFPAPNFNNCNNYQGCCPAPYNGTISEKLYVFDRKLPIRTRPAAHLLDDAYIAKYQRAYRLLRVLPDSDPRSWKNQAKLHCAYCNAAFNFDVLTSSGSSTMRFEVHYGWMFLPWHRFFLYFHERILAKLLGDDDTFALPFWNWDDQSPDPPLANVIPLAFANPMYDNKVQSSLYDERRNRCTKWPNLIDLQDALECANQTLELQTSLRQWNNRLMYTQLVTAAPISRLFFGESYKLGSAPGRGAGTLEYAAFDPIFYAHHGNIDRLWEVWKSLPGGNRKDLSQADYLNTQFLFYDENAALVKVQISQALNINNFRYNYEDVPNSWIHEGSDAASAPCFPASTSEINEMILNTPPLSTKNFTTIANSSITFRVRRPLEKQLHREEVLVIRSLKLEGPVGPVLNAFLYFPTANPTTPITCIEFFGKPGGFGVVFGKDLPDSKMEWRLALGYKLQSLGMDQFSHVVVTLVQVGLPQIIQLKNAQIVYFDE